MSKDIKLEQIEAYTSKYENDVFAKAMRHALNKNSITTIANVQEASSKTQCQFSIDIKTMSAVSQEASGRCWLFAGLNVLREEVAKKCKIKEFELSQNYVAFYDKLEKINYTMESCIKLKDQPIDDRTLTWVLQTGVQDGGQWDMIVSLIKKYGVVPKTVMPETYQSSHTRDMNGIINKKIRQFNSKIRSLDVDGIAKLKDKTLEELYTFLCTCFGIPPKQFDFEYVDEDGKYHIVKDLTPHQFYDEYVGIDLDDYVSITNAPTKDKPFNHTFTVNYIGNVVGGNPIRYLNLDLPDFKAAVLKQLKDYQVVWFGSDCGKDGDREGGTWDNNAYDYETAFGFDLGMTKEEMLDNRQAAMNHAMVITGVNLDGEQPTKWKIENSWGPDKANKGYYVMSDSWFDLYVFQAVVNKKYLTKEQLEALESDPIELNPWDPMGTLA